MRPDQDTFVELQFRKYYPSLMQAAVKILKNTSLAQDLVQDTFLALIDAIDEVRDHPDIKGWLHRALLNRLKWYFRDQKRYNALFLSMSSDFPIEPGEEDKDLDAVGLDWSRDLAEVRQGLSGVLYLQASGAGQGQLFGTGPRAWRFRLRFEETTRAIDQKVAQIVSTYSK